MKNLSYPLFKMYYVHDFVQESINFLKQEIIKACQTVFKDCFFLVYCKFRTS